MSKSSLTDRKQTSFLHTVLGLFILLGFFYGILSILKNPEESLRNLSTTDQDESARTIKKSSSLPSNELRPIAQDETSSKQTPPSGTAPNNVDLLFQRALTEVREKSDPDAARILLQDVLRRDPNHIAAAEELYASYARTGDFEGALAVLQKLETDIASPEHAGLDYSQGRLFLELGHPDVARVHLEQALQSGAENPLVREQLATAYTNLGERELAQREWQILAQDETAGQASLNAKARLAELLFAEGHRAEAESYVREVLQQDPQHRLGILISGR